MSEILGFSIIQIIKAIGKLVFWSFLAFTLSLFFDENRLNLFLTAWALFCLADIFIWLVNTVWALVNYKLTQRNRLALTKDNLKHENYISASLYDQYDPEYWLQENLGHFVDDVFENYIPDYNQEVRDQVITPFFKLSVLTGYRQALKETNPLLFWLAERTMRKALKENAKNVSTAMD